MNVLTQVQLDEITALQKKLDAIRIQEQMIIKELRKLIYKIEEN